MHKKSNNEFHRIYFKSKNDAMWYQHKSSHHSQQMEYPSQRPHYLQCEMYCPFFFPFIGPYSTMLSQSNQSTTYTSQSWNLHFDLCQIVQFQCRYNFHLHFFICLSILMFHGVLLLGVLYECAIAVVCFCCSTCSLVSQDFSVFFSNATRAIFSHTPSHAFVLLLL